MLHGVGEKNHSHAHEQNKNNGVKCKILFEALHNIKTRDLILYSVVFGRNKQKGLIFLIHRCLYGVESCVYGYVHIKKKHIF